MKMEQEIIFLLDLSSSMLESDTIGGFNSFLTKQKQVAGEVRVITALFIFLEANIDAVQEVKDIGIERKASNKDVEMMYNQINDKVM
ncbi:hypothetical protein [Metabacillus litoralis]|uniref:hypothetical protein n=1 Tax=Metabacillus litoralis TaxID=152268 RepID=UPI001CFDE72F|nr:hypothetical protein [Metabacillus litoralis]